jgi:N-acetylmuramoyl-L-alanine amidase
MPDEHRQRQRLWQERYRVSRRLTPRAPLRRQESRTVFPVILEAVAAASRYCASPNFNARPAGTIIDTVVLHATVLNTLDEVVQHFANPDAKVSAHYTIDRDGTIVSHVSEEQRAWHAGQSRMKDGRTNVNDFSVGIELINLNDGVDPFPEAQIQAMRGLLTDIISRHPIRHIVTHYECADPPGRKSDPNGFQPGWIEGLLSES